MLHQLDKEKEVSYVCTQELRDYLALGALYNPRLIFYVT